MADKKCEYYYAEDDCCVIQDLYTPCECCDKHECPIWQEEDKQEQERQEWRKKFFES